LTVNENNVAFGSDGQSIIAFDVNTGIQQRSFQPGQSQGAALIAPATQGGLAAVQLADFDGSADANPNAILSFDSTGALSPTPFSGSASTVGYLDTDELLAVAGSGQGEKLTAASLDPDAPWRTCGDPAHKRASVAMQITKVARNRAMVGSTTNLFVRGTQFGQSPQLIFGDPNNPRTDLTIQNFRYDRDTGVITADINVAPNAVGDKVLIFVRNGKQTSAANNNAFFFVQIPTSLSGAPFPGKFDTILASGVGPLHLPHFGPTDFVFDAAGEKVDTDDITPVCGVYRNFAFQLLDQDKPLPQPIEAATPVVENLSDSDPIQSSTNTSGVVLDTHAAVKATSCPQNNQFRDLIQGFSVLVGNQPFKLTTVFHIVVGNVNGILTEHTKVVHQ
jgi:hypothetical protein